MLHHRSCPDLAPAVICFLRMKGFTALHVAARCGHLLVVRELLEAGTPVDVRSTPTGTTALHLAAGFLRLDCLGELLAQGADPLVRNKRGKFPSDLVGIFVPLATPVAGDMAPSCATLEADASRREAGQRLSSASKTAHARQLRRAVMHVYVEVRRRHSMEIRHFGPRDTSRHASQIVCGTKRKWSPMSAEEDFARTGTWASLIGRLCVQSETGLIHRVIHFL